MIKKLFNYFIVLIICIVPLIITPWLKDYYYAPKAVFIYILCFITLTALIYNRKENRFHLDNIDKSCILYFIIAAVSTIFSVNPLQSLIGRPLRCDGFITLSCYLFIFYISSKYYTPSKKHLDLFIFCGIIICIYAIGQYFGYDPVKSDAIRSDWIKHRFAYATLGNPNFLGSYLTMLLPVGMFLYTYYGKKIYLFSSSVIFMTLLCSRTRGAWLGFLISSIIFIHLILKSKLNVQRLLHILAAFMVITLFINLYSHNETAQRFNSIAKDFQSVVDKVQTNERAGSKRIFIWERSIKLLPLNPLIGSGPDTFDIVFMNHYGNDVKRQFGNILVDKAHNEYLQIAITTGIPSLMLYLYIVYFVLLKAVKKANKNILIIPFLCGITGYLIQAFFSISVLSAAPVFFAMLGILRNISTKSVE